MLSFSYKPSLLIMENTNLRTFFFHLPTGYNQGVLGTVSATPGFIKMADIGHDGVVTNTTKQGGLAAAYYFGGMWGCFIGGTIEPLERGPMSNNRKNQADEC